MDFLARDLLGAVGAGTAGLLKPTIVRGTVETAGVVAGDVDAAMGILQSGDFGRGEEDEEELEEVVKAERGRAQSDDCFKREQFF